MLVVLIIFVSGFTRFYRLMHDSPYFFNPDERNMAIAILQFRLPHTGIEVPGCILNELTGKNFFKRETDHSSQGLLQNPNCNLNPHFYAYSQFPLYLSFVSDLLTKPLRNIIIRDPARLVSQNQTYVSTEFPQAIFFLRFWSAMASVLTVYFVYRISRRLTDTFYEKLKKLSVPITESASGKQMHEDMLPFLIPLLVALITAFLPGLVQAAHFGTTESLLTFFFLWSLDNSFSLLDTGSNRIMKFWSRKYVNLLLAAFIAGLALATKFTGLFFFVPPGLALSINILRLKNRDRKYLAYSFFYVVLIILIFSAGLLVSAVFSPYNLIEKESYQSAVFGYEREVAMGKFEAFYTVQFKNTVPLLFQVQKVFPYALGIPVFIFGSIGFLFILVKLLHLVYILLRSRIMNYELRIKHKKELSLFQIPNSYFLILTSSFLIYLIPNAILYAKWTRFLTPVFPFFPIFSGYLLHLLVWHLRKYFIRINVFNSSLFFVLCSLFIMPGIAFMSIYAREDIRLTASRWIYEHIPDGSFMLSETANVVDIPLGLPEKNSAGTDKKFTVISFDFYHLDENPQLVNQLIAFLDKADYIFIPSRRIFKNYPRFPEKYPVLSRYYSLLFSGSLGFEQVVGISSFPSLGIRNPLMITFPDEDAEETFTVFDHPVVRIYKKVRQYTPDGYQNMLKSV